MPDILITPTDLMQFVKKVEGGSVCINPGSVIKADVAGTYCSINIQPFDYRGFRGNPAEIKGSDLKIAERIRVDINNI